jgi:hypothetical protein
MSQTTGMRSVTQSTSGGTKGAARSRPKDVVGSGGSILVGGAERPEYPPERPRLGGGFRSILHGGSFSMTFRNA